MNRNRRLLMVTVLLVLTIALSGCSVTRQLRDVLPNFKPGSDAQLLGAHLIMGGQIDGLRVYINNVKVVEHGGLLNANGEWQRYGAGRPLENPWGPEWLFPKEWWFHTNLGVGEPGNPLLNVIAVEMTREDDNATCGSGFVFELTNTISVYPYSKDVEKPYVWLGSVDGQVDDRVNWYRMDYEPSEMVQVNGEGPIHQTFWGALSQSWGQPHYPNMFGRYTDSIMSWGSTGGYWGQYTNPVGRVSYMRVEFWLEKDKDGFIHIVPNPNI